MDQFPSPLAALAWLLEAGVDVALDDRAVDRFAVPQPPPAKLAGTPSTVGRPMPPPQPVRATVSVEAAMIDAARQLADSCADLAALERAIRAFDGGGLKAGALNTVIADGIAGAPLMVIGEAPGAEEDAKGLPFVGRAGQLLDRMLAAIGYSRTTNAYITNVIYWRPPGNRKPTVAETALCRPFVERLISLCEPRVILLLGGTPSTALLDSKVGITRLRGQWHSFLGRPVMPSLHPAYLLRNPAAKADSWRDLLALQARLTADD